MPYDPARTKAAVFAAAVDEFAAHGLAGARVDRIARGAGVDKKAIYLYFGDKRTLFDAVLASELARLVEAVPVDRDDVSAYVRRLFEYHRANPQYLRLMQWEALELGTATVPGEAERAPHYRERVETLRGARADGELDPAGTWLALVGMTSWVFAAPQLTRMVLGDDPDALDAHRELLVAAAARIVDSTGAAAPA